MNNKSQLLKKIIRTVFCIKKRFKPAKFDKPYTVFDEKLNY